MRILITGAAGFIGSNLVKAVFVSSNFASADFRKIKTYTFQKSKSYRFQKLRVVRWCDTLSSAVKLEKEKGCLSLNCLKSKDRQPMTQSKLISIVTCGKYSLKS